MTIKQQLYLLGSTSLSTIIFSLFSFSYFEGKISSLMAADHDLSQLELTLMQLRRNEKDFLLRKDEKYLERFNNNIDKFIHNGNNLLKTLSKHDVTIEANLERDLKVYQTNFNRLVNAYLALGNEANPEQQQKLKQTIGLSYDQGLLGETRAASHRVENQFDSVRQILIKSIELRTDELTTGKYSFVMLIFALFLTMLSWTSRGINLKVHNMLSIIKRIRENNDLTLRADSKGSDEFSLIGQHLNSLLDELDQHIHKSKQESDELNRNASEINSQIVLLASGFKNQSDQTSFMAGSTEEISANIKDISNNTKETVEEIRKAAECATQGQRTLESTTQNIQHLSDTLSNSQSTVFTLSENVNQIVNTMTLIQEIAEQTNLLSLNAAIEAARAGEQGRGFAVVADEVRSLAKRTSRSTEEIYQIVNAIDAQMKTVVKEIAECNEQSDKTANDAMELDKSLMQIQKNMVSVESQSQLISDSLNEQDGVLIQLNQSIACLTEISFKNSQLLTTCSNKIEDVNAQSERMNESVKLFRISEQGT